MGLFLQGLTLGLAYTAPIGMQNLFVINSALTKPRRRALLTGLVVLHIGAGLLFARKQGQASDNIAQSRNTAHQVASRFGGDNELLSTIITAGVVTWLNPQAIIDGTLMLGAFSATLTMSQSTPFITGVEIASALWFIGLTLLISVFSHKFSPKVIGFMNRACGAVVMLYGIKLLADFAIAIL